VQFRSLLVLTLSLAALFGAHPGAHAAKKPTVAQLVTQAKRLKQQKKLREAQKLLEQAVERAPKSAAAHSALAWVLLARKQDEGAARHFREVLSIAPHSAQGKEAQKVLVRMRRASLAKQAAQEKAAEAALAREEAELEAEEATPAARAAAQVPVDSDSVREWVGIFRLVLRAGWVVLLAALAVAWVLTRNAGKARQDAKAHA